MAFSDGKHTVGDKIWVYNFHRLGGKGGHFHNIKPSYGIIVGSHGIDEIEQDIGSTSFFNIVLYKTKNGKSTNILSSKKLDIFKVKIADSYEEAVNEYNTLVNEEINFYKEKLRQVESYLIKD